MNGARVLDSGARWGLVALVVFAPLPFGAVLGWTTALIASTLGLLLAAVFLRYVLEPAELPRGVGSIVVAGTLLALPAVLQLVPLPRPLMNMVSPTTVAFYDSNQLGEQTWNTLSQDGSLTTGALLWLGTCAGAAVLVVVLFDRRGLRRMLLALVVLGVVESFYGLLEFLSGRNHIFLFEKRHYLDSATGTYINRNHFAGLLVMLLPIGLAFLLARLGKHHHSHSPENWRRRLLRLADPERHQTILLGLAIVVMATGLGLSFSRAGVTLGLLALAATVAVHGLARSRRRFGRSRTGLLWASILVLFAIVPLAIRGPGRLASMAGDVPVELTSTSGRPAVWAATLRMAVDHPVLGTGLGTFGMAFPRYRPVTVRDTYSHAHQDYLQWFAETGLLGGLVGVVVLVGLALTATRAIKRPERRRDRIIAVGIVAGLAGFALHGVVDFNGHIPANTLMASVLAASLVVLARDGLRESAT